MQQAIDLLERIRPGEKLPRFTPQCFYLKELDTLYYLRRECTYVARRTSEPHLEVLTCDGEVVGMKIVGFLELPREIRRRILDSTHVDLDDIRGIEEIWMKNFEEMSPAIFRSQACFLTELKVRLEKERRHKRWLGNGLYHPSSRSVEERHANVMHHLHSLHAARLPL